ncbi:uncharacterized protein LOC111919691 isoform X1 [Lactuca sativa]|uniref:uncharacterized protein LOC111919691 isoform X1 n=1 Tax=Lactuca sativa TaxID=4236 RepID=UPI001C688C7B|nr:uncharacterized protein LOC111919691 isoform X1 [Lactuca sativa]
MKHWKMQSRSLLLHLLNLSILYRLGVVHALSTICEFSITQENKFYSYSLASPSETFPHGVLSEDGYYKVSSNGTVVWFQVVSNSYYIILHVCHQPCYSKLTSYLSSFLCGLWGQLCDGMIFNHDPPRCFDCWDCGGSSRCGMGCSALMSEIKLGYPVCTAIGRTQTITTDLIDKENPDMGIVVKTWHQGSERNCSLSVSVICDSKQVQGPKTLERVGVCNFVTQITHPAGCANVLSAPGSGLGWFGTLLIILLCLFGAYFIAGAAYRYFYLGIRGIDIIPNLEFWASLPHRIRSSYMSLVRRFRGPSQSYRSSYSPVDF